jgi:hypothetical protein
LFASAQSQKQTDSETQTKEEKYYLYNIVTFSGSMKNESISLYIDNGRFIEKLKDSHGNKLKFNTPAAALMYLIYQGWELYMSGPTSVSTLSNNQDTATYWLIRKPCSKEDFENAVTWGIKW